MSSLDLRPYSLPRLDEIAAETVSFGVPFINGAFLLNAPPGFSSARETMTLSREHPEVTIARENGGPFQFDEVAPTGQRRPMLREPIVAAVLRMCDEDGMYMLTSSHNLSVRDYAWPAMEGTLRLISEVALNAETKQIKQRQAAQVRRLLDGFQD